MLTMGTGQYSAGRAGVLQSGCSPPHGARGAPRARFRDPGLRSDPQGPGRTRPQTHLNRETEPHLLWTLTAWPAAPRPARRAPGQAPTPPSGSPPAVSPAAAHLRAARVLLFLLPEASAAARRRPLPFPPSPRPLGAGTAPFGPFSPPPSAPSVASLPPAPGRALRVRVSRTRRERPQTQERAPRMTTNSSRRCGVVRLSPCRLPARCLAPLPCAD